MPGRYNALRNTHDIEYDYYYGVFMRIDLPQGDQRRSTLVSRNINVLGHRTSMRLEQEMWDSLQAIAKREQCSTSDLCSLIQVCKRPNSTLTASVRVFLMLYYRAAATEDGHIRAGHGDFANMLKRARMSGDKLSLIKQQPRLEQRIQESLNGGESVNFQSGRCG